MNNVRKYSAVRNNTSMYTYIYIIVYFPGDCDTVVHRIEYITGIVTKTYNFHLQ
jgi:hypothetical protein